MFEYLVLIFGDFTVDFVIDVKAVVCTYKNILMSVFEQAGDLIAGQKLRSMYVGTELFKVVSVELIQTASCCYPDKSVAVLKQSSYLSIRQVYQI